MFCALAQGTVVADTGVCPPTHNHTGRSQLLRGNSRPVSREQRAVTSTVTAAGTAIAWPYAMNTANRNPSPARPPTHQRSVTEECVFGVHFL